MSEILAGLFRQSRTNSRVMPRILILTASMGEGHNTAARNIRDALLEESGATAEVLVADPYTRTNPVINKLMQRGYTTAINRYPRAWKVVFELLSKRGVVEGMGPMLAELTAAVKALMDEFRPDIIASTYPVFSFLIAKIRRRHSSVTVPFYTVITDSTMINSAWYRCPCDGSIVADEQTARVLRSDGVPSQKIHVLGFPVGLAFESLQPAAPPSKEEWKAIFFPSGVSEFAAKVLTHLAEIPRLHVTVVTGRRQQVLQKLQDARLPRHGSLLGWTDQMPAMMTSHHIFIGKAGGATVQEAIAAQIPFLVSHVVPGQEEGNIALIEQTGIGALAVGNPQRIRDMILGAMANDAILWKAWRANLAALKKPPASRAIARFLLGRAGAHPA
ncbi:MAG: glycosyltransferase [Terrimicrobiaceae bacterium]